MKTHGVLFAALALFAQGAAALDVNVIGLFPGKAVVTINRGAPRTLSVGERTAEGVLLVSVDARGAVVEIEGKRETLELGQHFASSSSAGTRQEVTLSPDSRGQYFVDGQVNGGHVRFIVDTGATYVRLSTSEAQRLGIHYHRGVRGIAILADGPPVPADPIQLAHVTIADPTPLNVDASA